MFLRGFYVFHLPYKLVVAVICISILAWAFFYHITELIEKRTMEAMSWAAANKIIVIDPGHGGYDAGASGPGGTKEKDITLAVSKKLAKELSKAGSMVILTREEDRDFLTPGPGTKKSRDLKARLDIVNKNNAEIYINIQTNAFGTKWKGAQTFYNPKNDNNEKMAYYIQEELKTISNTNREIKSNTTNYMLKNLDIPAVMVEVGFISNPEEEKLLNNPIYQEELTHGIYVGLIRYLLEYGGS